nr:EOG090X07PD [Lepidurus arcticus]
MVSEMFHTASLVHDDVIDMADKRRGKLSINKVSSQQKAVMSGDYIIAVAARMLAQLRNDEVVIILSYVLRDLVNGEFMQMGAKAEDKTVFDHYLTKTFMKTASLIAYSCQAFRALLEALVNAEVTRIMEEVTEQKEFDIIRGGNLALPSDVSILQFAAARAEEIAALTAAIENPNKTALIFQKLPRHLRRRAMSHVPNRMPRKVREAHKAQMAKSGVSKVNKRPSRKYRRRPRNLLDEYNRRQKDNVWLETHIWHAKRYLHQSSDSSLRIIGFYRFHMAEKWGYKLPNYPNDRSFRACYRAIAKHCLLQDVSYLCCVELRGTETEIRQGFLRLSSPESTLFSREHTNGQQEGKLTIFARDSYPGNALGEVSFHWQYSEAAQDRVLWLWIHPASYEEILAEITSIFALTELQSQDSSEVNGLGSNDKVTAKKLAVKNLDRSPRWRNVSASVEVVVLKDTLNRFRLIGPLAAPILQHVLQSADIEIASNEQKDEPASKKLKLDLQNPTEGQCWWRDFYHDSKHPERPICHQLQRNVWSALARPSNTVRPHSIVPLTVRDPRLLLPPKRTKALTAPEDIETETEEKAENGDVIDVDSRALLSPFWDVKIRNAATMQRLSDHEINQMRSKLLVPGTSLSLGDRESRIPVLLIQLPNPSPQTQGFGLGWDLVCPAGWGMAFWMNLVYRGGRVGGLKESRGFHYESGVLDPNIAWPDTPSAQRELALQEKELSEEYFKKPPKNRANYIKLGTSCPFVPHWNQLVRDWYIGTAANWYTLRWPSRQLEQLRLVWSSTGNALPDDVSWLRESLASQPCLVAVQVVCLGKGKPESNASISLPTDEDLQTLTLDAAFVGPVEALHADRNANLRKKMREEHEKELKKLRRKRVQAKQSGDTDRIQAIQRQSQDVCNQFNEKTRNLWLPRESHVEEVAKQQQQEKESIKAAGSRNIIGFCSHADYSFRKARGCGNGFVVGLGLVELMKQAQTLNDQRRIVLLRNPTSSQYMFASLQIL